MKLLMPKNKIDHISVRDNRKIDFTKKHIHFSIFTSEIFRVGVYCHRTLFIGPDFDGQIPKFGGQNSEFGRQIS